MPTTCTPGMFTRMRTVAWRKVETAAGRGGREEMLLGQEEGLVEGLARPPGVAILASPAGVRQAGPGGSSSQRYFLFGNHISRQPCCDTSIYQQQK